MARLFKLQRPLGKSFLAAQVFWLLIIGASLLGNQFYLRHEVEEVALGQARAIFQRDKTFRRWLSQVGGVYTRPSDMIPPNPYLAHIPERDILTAAGAPLTLINPAYMMRLVYEYDHEHESPLARMVSGRPLRPESLPDAWEQAALEQVETGVHEVYGVAALQGQPNFRYLRAAYTEQHCLKCHAQQGYKVGDLRGGLSVALPMNSLLARHESVLRNLALWHLLIYLLGAGLLFWAQGLMGRRMLERDRARDELAASEEKFRTVADFAFAWEYWLDPAGRFRYISPSVEKITGHPPERFLEDPNFVKTIIAENDREILHVHLREERRREVNEVDFRIRTASGQIRWLRHICRPVFGADGSYQGRRASNYDITEEVSAEQQLQEMVGELREALGKVRLLSTFLPICASCKKIRDDRGYWHQVETYISQNSDTVFSHGICPDCKRRDYPEFCDKDEA